MLKILLITVAVTALASRAHADVDVSSDVQEVSFQDYFALSKKIEPSVASSQSPSERGTHLIFPLTTSLTLFATEPSTRCSSESKEAVHSRHEISFQTTQGTERRKGSEC